MYSVVLMVAMSSSGDTVAFGKDRGNGCNGCNGSGFIGLRDRDRGGCNGGGFLGLRDRKGCHGSSNGCNGMTESHSYGCNGHTPSMGGCSGGTIIVTPPEGTTPPIVMPKEGGTTPPIVKDPKGTTPPIVKPKDKD